MHEYFDISESQQTCKLFSEKEMLEFGDWSEMFPIPGVGKVKKPNSEIAISYTDERPSFSSMFRLVLTLKRSGVTQYVIADFIFDFHDELFSKVMSFE